MKGLGRFLSAGNAALSAVAGILVLVMVLHVTIDVILRYAFNMPIPGTILAVSTFYMTAVVFLPLGLSEEKDAHIAVEVVYDLLGNGARRALDVLGLVVSIIVLSMLTMRTFEEAMAKFRIGAATVESGVKIATWPSYWLLPLGFGFMGLVIVLRLVRVMRGEPARRPGPTFDEADLPRVSE